MQVKVKDLLLDLIIIYKNNKNIYLKVKDDLKLYVTCNRLVSKNEILKLISENEDAIIKMHDHVKSQNKANKEFYYLGEKYNEVFDENVKMAYFDEENVYFKDLKMKEKFWKSECIKVFNQRINAFLPLFNYLPNFVLKIRFMKTRWGVCNRGNNTITLNTELLKKEQTLIDYVIVHELCHFKHPNHSKDFWNEVSKYYPYYHLARKKLKEV